MMPKNKKTPASLGEEIREARRARRLTQVELAELAGIDQSTLSAIERGTQGLTLGTLARLAGALAVRFTVDARGPAISL